MMTLLRKMMVRVNILQNVANIDNLEVNQDGTEVTVIFYITQDELIM